MIIITTLSTILFGNLWDVGCYGQRNEWPQFKSFIILPAMYIFKPFVFVNYAICICFDCNVITNKTIYLALYLAKQLCHY